MKITIEPIYDENGIVSLVRVEILTIHGSGPVFLLPLLDEFHKAVVFDLTHLEE